MMWFFSFGHNINWWLLIGVAIVVAVIASLITAGITGNVIKVNQDRWGKNLVYTKAEVDGISNKILEEMRNSGYLTSFDTLYMLNKCDVVDGLDSGITNPADYNCKNICSKKGKLICIFGIGTFKAENSSLGDQRVVIRSCSTSTSPHNTYLSCNCCTP